MIVYKIYQKNDDVEEIYESNVLINGKEWTFIDHHKTPTTLIFNDSISLKKQGNPKIDFEFSQSRQTKGTYLIDGMVLDFDIKTIFIEIKENIVQIEYQLLQSNDIVSTNLIQLTKKE
jgi:uncharacterized beta-barrel protein YwiB (DUF1934 family)